MSDNHLPPAQNPGPPPLTVVFASSDKALADAALEAHGDSVQRYFFEQHIPGDGNCLYRAASYQTADGERHHDVLRQVALQEVRRNKPFFHAFFPTVPAMTKWINAQNKPNSWGDGHSFQAITVALQRPILVWMKNVPEQPPSAFVDFTYIVGQAYNPIYLFLDESITGCEHLDLPTQSRQETILLTH